MLADERARLGAGEWVEIDAFAAASRLTRLDCDARLEQLSTLGDVRLSRVPCFSYQDAVALTEEGDAKQLSLRISEPGGIAADFGDDLDRLQRAVLDDVVEQEQRIAGPAIRRGDVRGRVRQRHPAVAGPALTQVIDGLAPRYLTVQSGLIGVTLRGLLASRWGANALDIIDRTMSAQRILLARARVLRNFSWATLGEITGLPHRAQNLAYLAITLAELGDGLYPVDDDTTLGRGWAVPPDLDLLLESSPNALALVRAQLGKGTNERREVAPVQGASRARTNVLTNGEQPSFAADGATSSRPVARLAVSAERLASLVPTVDVLLLTAVRVERDAVLAAMQPLPRQRAILCGTLDGKRYSVGRLGAHAIVLTKSRAGSGNRDGSLLTVKRALERWRPRAVIAVGIAFGGKTSSLRIADVLVSTSLCLYEVLREQAGGGIERGAIPDAGRILLEQFGDLDGWSFRRPDDRACAAHEGPLLSGEKLVDSLDFKTELFTRFPEAIGGEMEGSGIYAACADAHHTEWIVVKGVCDWADGTKGNHYQRLAADAATSAVKHVLSRKGALAEAPRSIGKTESNRAAGESKAHRSKDTQTLRRFMSAIDLDALDQFLQNATSLFFHGDILFFAENVERVVSASRFHIYDSSLRTRVHAFARAFLSCFAFHEWFARPDPRLREYAWTESAPGPRADEARSRFARCVRDTRTARRRLLEAVRADWPAVDVDQTTRTAQQEKRDAERIAKRMLHPRKKSGKPST